jgi:hypothetical protein
LQPARADSDCPSGRDVADPGIRHTAGEEQMGEWHRPSLCLPGVPEWDWPEAQKAVVRWAFGEWLGLGIGLRFEEVGDPAEAEIKIGRLDGDGSWSFVGTDILKNADRGRTMNFGWDLTTLWGHATGAS